jgi:hypothetical protein
LKTRPRTNLEAKANARTLKAKARPLEAKATKIYPRGSSMPRPVLEDYITGKFQRRDRRVKECEVRGRACRPWWLRE